MLIYICSPISGIHMFALWSCMDLIYQNQTSTEDFEFPFMNDISLYNKNAQCRMKMRVVLKSIADHAALLQIMVSVSFHHYEKASLIKTLSASDHFL